jgi:hypothetical protein
MQWRAEGRSVTETRSLVDAKYQGYGPSTDTPQVIDG